jgi:hypothetical protein
LFLKSFDLGLAPLGGNKRQSAGLSGKRQSLLKTFAAQLWLVALSNGLRMEGPVSVADPIFGPAAEADVQEVHLFMCLGKGHYAISNDRDGSNLPEHGTDGWRYVRTFQLGVREALPIAVDPEPVIRALRDRGFYIHDAGVLPHGTAQ